MDETHGEQLEIITAVEVLERFAEVLDGSIGTPERIEITRHTDVSYLARVYPVGDLDYEGFAFEL